MLFKSNQCPMHLRVFVNEMHVFLYIFAGRCILFPRTVYVCPPILREDGLQNQVAIQRQSVRETDSLFSPPETQAVSCFELFDILFGDPACHIFHTIKDIAIAI